MANQTLFNTCIVHVTHTNTISIYIDNLLPLEMNCSGLNCLDMGFCWSQQKLWRSLHWSFQSSFLQHLKCSIHVDILSRQHSSLTEKRVCTCLWYLMNVCTKSIICNELSWNAYHNHINILTSKTQCQIKVCLCSYKNVVPVTIIIKGSEKLAMLELALHCVQCTCW